MCLACAVPVRGGAVGTECLAATLGPGAPVETMPPREPGAAARAWARTAFAAAVLATLLPWSRFGAGSEPFGAWSDSLRWSMLAATAAAAGFVLVLAQRAARVRSPGWDAVAVGLAVLVFLGSILAILWPPPFTSPWVGPWASAAAGAVAVVSIALARRGAVEPDPAHV